MKRFLCFVVITIILTNILLSENVLTRGPIAGEIYYIAFTENGECLIKSNDSGESSECMDPGLSYDLPIERISADVTSEVIYGISWYSNLHRSMDSGQSGTWQALGASPLYNVISGRNPGEVYLGIASHSLDYGNTFIEHSLNGFTNLMSCLHSELDNADSIAYALVNKFGVQDSLWLMITYDNFENIEEQNSFDRTDPNDINIRKLSRGTQNGELFNLGQTPDNLHHSSDYGVTWNLNNTFNEGLLYKAIVGGRVDGEVYVLATKDVCTFDNLHTYIFHSLDYGRTFEVFNVYHFGYIPLVTNFSSAITEGQYPLTVQFKNYSVGDISSYEWDFNNDGVIDSTDPEPEYTFTEAGVYDVKLTIHDNFDQANEFLRDDYITITNTNNDSVELEKPFIQLSNYPNPFNPNTEIRFQVSNISHQNIEVEIYNIKGEKVRTMVPSFPEQSLGTQGDKISVTWNGIDQSGQPIASGIYFYKLNVENSPVGKMILLK